MSDWTTGKQAKAFALVALILLLGANLLTFDWTQHVFGLTRIDRPERPNSRLANTGRSFLVFLLGSADLLSSPDGHRAPHLSWRGEA